MFQMYSDVFSSKILYVNRKILKSILALIGSKCKRFKMGVI